MVRTITIVDNKSQGRYEFETEGDKLKDIIAGCKSLGISTIDVEFQEAYSRTVMRDPEAYLPTNVPTGHGDETTNDLVIVVTAPKKKIKSGATVSSRAEAYDYIKAHGLKDAVASKFGKNFTQCKTDDLVAFCQKAKKSDCGCGSSTVVEKALDLVEKLYKNNAISKAVYSNLKSVLEGGEAAPIKKRLSDDELQKLVGRLS